MIRFNCMMKRLKVKSAKVEDFLFIVVVFVLGILLSYRYGIIQVHLEPVLNFRRTRLNDRQCSIH